jgi:hypothetical protein
MSDRPIPLLGTISLDSVQEIRHDLDSGFASSPIVGLDGDLQQRTNRRSHRIVIAGLLFGDSTADQLKTLQEAAAKGDELTFSADITKALDLQKVVITEFTAVQLAAEPNRYQFRVALAESPPLPPPAQISGFGGLDDFGLGDLGFDTSLLGDLQGLAGDIAGAVNDALNVVNALSALSNLDGLSISGVLDPLNASVGQVSNIGASLKKAMGDMAQVFG